METNSSAAYPGVGENRFNPNEQKKPQIQLTQEELRVLRDCNRESFYYRCLPFAVTGMAATFLAIKNGFLRAHPKWGPAGKMTGAALVGWFLGKISYRSVCEDKFLNLKNSAVGDAVRRRRGITSEMYGENQMFPEDNQLLKDDSYSFGNDDYNSSSGSLNLDVDKNVPYSGLDDRDRPTTDNENIYAENTEPGKRITSYEELRKSNRDNYDHRQQSQPPRSDSSQAVGPHRQWGQTESKKDVPKNAYGDQWDNAKFS